MKKMKLSLDALQVESFDTASFEKRTGTVRGAAQTEWNTCIGYGDTCNAADATCYDSCVCGTRYPDYCPKDTFQLVNSCIETCETCHVACRTCTCRTCFC